MRKIFSYKIKFDGCRTSDHLMVKLFMDADFLSFQMTLLILMLGFDYMDPIYYTLKFSASLLFSGLTMDHVRWGDIWHVEKPLSNKLQILLKKLTVGFRPLWICRCIVFQKKYFQCLIYYVQLSSNSIKFILTVFVDF